MCSELLIKKEYSQRLHDDMYVAWQDDTRLIGLGFKEPNGTIRCVWGKGSDSHSNHEKYVATEEEMHAYFAWVAKFHSDWSRV